MLKLTKTIVRPNTGVNFFSAPEAIADAVKGHVKTTYMDTGKLISTTNSTSEDGLTLTNVTIWQNLAALQEFRSDSVIVNGWISVKDAYNTQNGITETDLWEEI